MSNFTIEEVYGCSREEFCERTGTNMEDMMIRLRKEVTILEVNLAHQRDKYRNGGLITDDEQRMTAKLIKNIENKIKAKRDKVRDIEKYLENK